MKVPPPNKMLKYLVGALVVAMTLSTYGTFGENPSGPQKLDAAKVVQDTSGVSAPTQPVVPAPTAPTPQKSSAQPSGGLPPAAPPEQSPSTLGTPPSRQRGEIGRPNPFAPLVTVQRPARTSLPPSSSAPWLGAGLPLPPGFTVPGAPPPLTVPRGQGAPAPPPGDKMTVGAIIGGGERVAIIQDLGKIFVVGVGDRVGDAVVMQILEDKVVLRRGVVTFELRYEGGGS